MTTIDATKLLGVVITVLLVGCGPADDEPPDASPGRDAGAPGADAGPMTTDGGGEIDGGAATDAGPGPDAGPACGPPFAPCAETPTVTDEDGNEYPTVDICGQCWMASDLRVGTTVTVDPSGAPSASYQRDDGTTERYCPRNRDSGCAEYGGLYQFNELMAYGAGPRGICPAGWHVPSDEEWKTLERSLGMSAAEADRRSDGTPRGTDQAAQLLAGGSSGFDADLAGFASEVFGHYDISLPGSIGRYWTSTRSGTNAWYRGFSAPTSGVDRSIESGLHGYSARCLRD